jgi:hypothetical protein
MRNYGLSKNIPDAKQSTRPSKAPDQRELMRTSLPEYTTAEAGHTAVHHILPGHTVEAAAGNIGLAA